MGVEEVTEAGVFKQVIWFGVESFYAGTDGIEAIHYLIA